MFTHLSHSRGWFGTYKEEEEEEEIYLAQTQQIKCKYKSYTIQLSRVTGKPEGQLCRPPEHINFLNIKNYSNN